MLDEVRGEAKDDPDIHILDLPQWAPREVNALQRASTVALFRRAYAKASG